MSSKAKLGKRYNIIIIKLLNFYLIYPSKECRGETTCVRNVRGETSSGGETTRGKRLGGWGGAKRLGEEMVLERNDSDSIEQACGGLSPRIRVLLPPLQCRLTVIWHDTYRDRCMVGNRH